MPRRVFFVFLPYPSAHAPTLIAGSRPVKLRRARRARREGI
ncbi:hypothetical protein ANACOL_04015 [Anaerotruncus colihominis DSM 17241]|uniref:Uncharacterized protein n=1 Tax=Anaerotruncus colihominis DSM 17241 TaxID=445972 RepID=B0PGZ5_9FIRM|nr:hypothetical protein ANACOL_04015 [Anaerotruncus colihominis DSM 17241]